MGLQSERLYYGDSYLQVFDSVVEEVRVREGETWVRLRESAFYPTSGGQPHDTGTIEVEGRQDAYVVSQAEVDDGHVWHRVDGELKVGQGVIGHIDWPRRFDFMQQHCGQHILSACFDQAIGAATTSFHMGEPYSTIDLDMSSLSDSNVHDVLLEANRCIWRDMPVHARFVSEHELTSLKLRKPPRVTEDIRIVTIDGLEDNACGGTHPSSTGQVGQILITKTERMRGGIRVTFACGERALRAAKETVEVVRGVATRLSIGLSELPEAIDALQTQLKDSRRKYDALHERYARLFARDLATTQTRTICETRVLFAVLPDLDDVQELRRMAGSSSEWIGKTYPNHPQVIAFAGEHDGRTHMVVQATEGAVIQADTLVKEVLSTLDGKGGGNAKAAQGSAPASAAQVCAAMESVFLARTMPKSDS